MGSAIKHYFGRKNTEFGENLVFSDGPFIKNAILDSVTSMCTEKIGALEKVRRCHSTVIPPQGLRTSPAFPQNKPANCVSLPLDGSWDVCDPAQPHLLRLYNF